MDAVACVAGTRAASSRWAIPPTEQQLAEYRRIKNSAKQMPRRLLPHLTSRRYPLDGQLAVQMFASQIRKAKSAKRTARRLKPHLASGPYPLDGKLAGHRRIQHGPLLFQHTFHRLNDGSNGLELAQRLLRCGIGRVTVRSCAVSLNTQCACFALHSTCRPSINAIYTTAAKSASRLSTKFVQLRCATPLFLIARPPAGSLPAPACRPP